MNRLELLDKIEAVEPALSAKDTIPILTHLWFTGKTVMAFNDGIAIQALFDTDFKAAVPAVLTQLLRTSAADEVEMKLNGNGELSVKAATSRISLPTFPSDDFVFEMPGITEKEVRAGALISGESDNENAVAFFEAVDLAIQCVANEATVPEQLGVNLLPGPKDTVSIYSTNEKSLFHARLKTYRPLKKRVILSTEFCKQMLSLAKRDIGGAALYIRDDAALFNVRDEWQLFGKLIFSDSPLDFDSVLTRHFPDMGKKPKLSKIPNKMNIILDRAVIIIGNKGDTTVEVKEGTANFKSELNDRRVIDKMTVEGQSNITIKFNPALAKIALDSGSNQMRMMKDCIIFTKDDSVFLISAKV